VWLLVETEDDLAAAHTTRTGVLVSIKQVSGVKQVTDMSAISRRTLDDWLGEWFLPDDQVLLPKSRKAKA
jgi:hypothetical protein